MSYGTGPFGLGPFGAAPGGAAAPNPNDEDAAFAISVDVTGLEDAAFGLMVAVTQNEDAAFPLAVQVLGANAYGPVRWFSLAVTVGGVDFSARVTGLITVRGEEGAARVASFTLRPFNGAVSTFAFVGQAVAIDCVARDDTTGATRSVQRLFTGRVEVPEFDAGTGRVTFHCTDGRQDALAAMPFAAVDALLPVAAVYSAAAYSAPPADGFEYLERKVRTVPGAVDLTPFGAPRYTAWAAKPVADLEYSDALQNVVEGSVAVQEAELGEIRNEITIAFEYRFPRLFRAVISAGYGYPFSYEEMFTHGYRNLTRAAVKEALGAGGWEVLGEINFVPRRAGPFFLNFNTQPNPLDTTTAEIAEQLCMGFTARLMKRYAQWVTERYEITVRAPASIAKLGVISEQRSAALAVAFDTAEWEQPTAPSSKRTEGVLGEPQPAPPDVPTSGLGTGRTFVDVTTLPGTARADAEAGILAAVADAQVSEQSGHRGTRVSFETFLDGRLDLDKTVRLDNRGVTTKGKVFAVEHRMDLEAGEARTVVTLAVSRVEALGVQRHDAAAVPAAPAAPGATQTWHVTAQTWVGRSTGTPNALPANAIGLFTNVVAVTSPLYDAGKPVYDEKFTFATPDVPAADRDNAAVTVARTFECAIPDDEYVLRVS